MKKKLIGTMAFMSLALAGCGNDSGEKPADTTSKADTTEVTSNADSGRKDPNDVINSIKEDIKNSDARPSVELGMNSGVEWKDGGYQAALKDGKATVTGDTTGEKVFVVKDGEVTEEIDLGEGGAFEYETEAKDGDVLYLVADDRLEVGQKDVDLEDTDRAEKITYVAE